MVRTRRLRVGIFGAGWGTRVSVPAFRAAGWDVVGLWSRRRERADEEAARLEIPFATSDPAALFEHPEVDAVALHTPPGTHVGFCQAAFEAGKHVLCDKPFANDAADGRALVRLAASSGLVAMINFEFRFAPLRLQIADLLKQGAVGEFRHAAVSLQTNNPLVALGRPWRLDPAQGGGILNELGSHYVDRLRHWFGELTSVSAQLASFPPVDDPTLITEDWLGAICTFEQGGIATLEMSWVSDPPTGLRATVVGSDGVLRIRAAGSMLTDGEIAIARTGDDDFTTLPPRPEDLSFNAASGAIEASQRLIEAFAAGIASAESPAPNFDDGLRAQMAMDAIRESAARGRTVPIEPSR
jgi:predicted dehydrogenase